MFGDALEFFFHLNYLDFIYFLEVGFKTLIASYLGNQFWTI